MASVYRKCIQNLYVYPHLEFYLNDKIPYLWPLSFSKGPLMIFRFIIIFKESYQGVIYSI